MENALEVEKLMILVLSPNTHCKLSWNVLVTTSHSDTNGQLVMSDIDT